MVTLSRAYTKLLHIISKNVQSLTHTHFQKLLHVCRCTQQKDFIENIQVCVREFDFACHDFIPNFFFFWLYCPCHRGLHIDNILEGEEGGAAQGTTSQVDELFIKLTVMWLLVWLREPPDEKLHKILYGKFGCPPTDRLSYKYRKFSQRQILFWKPFKSLLH